MQRKYKSKHLKKSFFFNFYFNYKRPICDKLQGFLQILFLVPFQTLDDIHLNHTPI
jgi:hypothetical protein